jgi:hypothetical protein
MTGLIFPHLSWWTPLSVLQPRHIIITRNPGTVRQGGHRYCVSFNEWFYREECWFSSVYQFLRTLSFSVVLNLWFNVHGSVHLKYIAIYIQQDATLHSLFYLQTALHVSGGTTTHHQVSHPQHTQTCSNSCTTAADSSNGVTITRCCRYSSMRSWWWVMIPSETCRAVSK